MFSPLQRTPCSCLSAYQPKPWSSAQMDWNSFWVLQEHPNSSMLVFQLVAVCSSRPFSLRSPYCLFLHLGPQ